MAKRGAVAILGAAAVVGVYAAWRETQRKDAEQQAVIMPAGYVTGGSQQKLAALQQGGNQGGGGNLKSALVGWGVDTLFDAINRNGWLGGGKGKTDVPASSGGWVRDTLPGTANTNNPPSAKAGGVSALLNLIGGVEAPKGYDQVYGGIRSKDKPPKPLTSMTVGEVLDWQDSIDSRYRSEAAGRYQIMEDTLRDQVRKGNVSRDERFDRQTQDRIAVHLMNQRGLASYQAGVTSAEDFAQELSREWASLPAITRDRAGRKATGQSYYAGDGLNRSHVSQKTILDHVKGLL